jgi:hypothetical protein
MKNDYYKMSETVDIEASLYPKVLLAVEKAKKSFYLKVFSAWTALALVFSPVTFVLLSGLHRKLIESSTFEYISLIINDADARSLYFKDILLAVYDTIPVMGASVTLASLFLVILFYYKAMQTLSSFSLIKERAF